MEGRAFRNSPVGCSSEGASLPRWTVTRRSDQRAAGTEYLSHKAVTSWTLTELKASVMGCKEGMARVFAVRVQSWLRVLAQCRGTSCLGARNLSLCRIYIADRCACPGANTITNLSWVQELSKNRDKPIKHTDRVICCAILLSFYFLSHRVLLLQVQVLPLMAECTFQIVHEVLF